MEGHRLSGHGVRRQRNAIHAVAGTVLAEEEGESSRS